MRFQTRAVRAGQMPDRATGAVVPPLYQNVTFEMDAPGMARGFDYLRTGNPTRKALEEALASLEGARHAVCFSSGMAAIAAVASLLSPGDTSSPPSISTPGRTGSSPPCSRRPALRCLSLRRRTRRT